MITFWTGAFFFVVGLVLLIGKSGWALLLWYPDFF
jgi:hypothetical protein